MSFAPFLSELVHNPPLFFVTLLTLCTILVNGWTDAPNAIVTCVSTGALPLRAAVRLAAVCNFAGVAGMMMLNTSVADTMLHLAAFDASPAYGLTALCAALLAIVLWGVAAWWFGLPTSESHGLMAALAGSAAALGTAGRINFSGWGLVCLGLAVSVALGFALGVIMTRLIFILLGNCPRRFYQLCQILAGGMTALMHGAQDGQKFIGIFLLGLSLTGVTEHIQGTAPLWLIVLCSAVMALGTSIGGGRIIKKVGTQMVHLSPSQGFASDLAASLCLLSCSLWGMPVSTTHTKTTAMLGAGWADSRRSVQWGIFKQMAAAWLLTFPACAALGYALAKILFHLL